MERERKRGRKEDKRTKTTKGETGGDKEGDERRQRDKGRESIIATKLNNDTFKHITTGKRE